MYTYLYESLWIQGWYNMILFRQSSPLSLIEKGWKNRCAEVRWLDPQQVELVQIRPRGGGVWKGKALVTPTFPEKEGPPPFWRFLLGKPGVEHLPPDSLPGLHLQAANIYGMRLQRGAIGDSEGHGSRSRRGHLPLYFSALLPLKFGLMWFKFGLMCGHFVEVGFFRRHMPRSFGSEKSG